MNSFISNFRNTLRIAIGMVAVLLAMEVACRFLLFRYSFDLKEINSISVKSSRLANSNGEETAVILGNSLTREGLAPEELASALSPISLEVIALNGAFVGEWEWIADQHFRGNRTPKFLIINANAWAIGDTSSARTYRLARIANSSISLEVPHCLKWKIEEVCEYFVGRCSLAFAWRSRIGEMIKERAIPNYREGMVRKNHVAGNSPRDSNPTFQSLAVLLEKMNNQGTSVIVVAMPTREKYDLPSEFTWCLKKGPNHLLDLRNIDIEPSLFVDEIHLSREGKAKFTPVYSVRVRELLSEVSNQRTE